LMKDTTSPRATRASIAASPLKRQSDSGSAERDVERSGADGNTADRLLQSAASLFRRKGYAATTTRELAGELGIQRASLYHHIRGKEDLLFDISMASLEHITAAVTEAAEQASDAERLEAMISAHLQAALDDRNMHMTMLIELRALSEERRVAVLAHRDTYEGLLRDAIRADQDSGRLRTDIDARYLTLSLLNLLNWTIFWFDPNGDMTSLELARIMCTVFLDGVRTLSPQRE